MVPFSPFGPVGPTTVEMSPGRPLSPGFPRIDWWCSKVLRFLFAARWFRYLGVLAIPADPSLREPPLFRWDLSSPVDPMVQVDQAVLFRP